MTAADVRDVRDRWGPPHIPLHGAKECRQCAIYWLARAALTAHAQRIVQTTRLIECELAYDMVDEQLVAGWTAVRRLAGELQEARTLVEAYRAAKTKAVAALDRAWDAIRDARWALQDVESPWARGATLVRTTTSYLQRPGEAGERVLAPLDPRALPAPRFPRRAD